MTTTRRRWPMTLGIIIASILALVLIYVLVIGRVLVREEEPKQADSIVVLLGGTPERIVEAVYLYREGYSEEIIMVETLKEHEDILEEEGVEIDIGEETEYSIAVQMGVPEEAITIIPARTESTQDEAVALRDYLDLDERIGSILLVTSKSHSGRSSMIFNRALRKLDHDVELTSVPSRLDDFDAKRWFTDREEIQEVLAETVKLFNYLLRERWQL